MDKDPGNSGPEEWTEELDEAEQAQARQLLDEEFGGEDDGRSGSGDLD